MRDGFKRIVAGLAVAFAVTGSAIDAQKAPSAAMTPEAGALARIRDQFQAFDRQSAGLGNKAQVTQAEINALQRQADGVKALLPELERQVASAISKVKAAGKWTAELDQTVADALRRAGRSQDLQAVQEEGGPRKFLESISRGTADIAADIDARVRSVRTKKAAWRSLIDPMVEALLGQPVLALTRGLRTVRTVSLIQAVTCLAQGIHGGYCGL
ncbi:MAG: hypothetical protein WD690_09465 [Vicinamibacterales bacterium]